MSIVAAGSIALDDVVAESGAVHDVPGGSVLYFAVAASLFATVHLVSIAGDDFPEEELSFLKKRGVNLDNLKIVRNGKTFRWGTKYDSDMSGRKTIRRELNVSAEYEPNLNDKSRKAGYVFLANMEPDRQMRVLEQVEAPRFVAMDTMECYIRDDLPGLKAVLPRIDMLFINDSEARLVTGKANLLMAAREFLAMGPRYVVVKKGEHGSILVSDNMFFTAPAYPARTVIDPTGAGDSFAGGAMGFLAKANSLSPDNIKQAVVYGGITASFCIEDFSINALRNITLADIEERLTRFRAITRF